jgi:hypothetical protein
MTQITHVPISGLMHVAIFLNARLLWRLTRRPRPQYQKALATPAQSNAASRWTSPAWAFSPPPAGRARPAWSRSNYARREPRRPFSFLTTASPRGRRRRPFSFLTTQHTQSHTVHNKHPHEHFFCLPRAPAGTCIEHQEAPVAAVGACQCAKRVRHSVAVVHDSIK